MYRETQGNVLILFYHIVAQIFASQSNPLVIIPQALQGVFIRLMRDADGNLIIFVTGFSIIARYMITTGVFANDGSKSDGGALWNKLNCFGMAEYWQSAAFRARCTQLRGQILNCATAVLAVFHIDIPQLTRDVIYAVPPVDTSVGRYDLNKNYRRDNFPGLYVGRQRFESANALYKSKLIRKRREAVFNFVDGLYESYFQQETPGPVRDTLKGVTVVCKLPGMRS